MSADAELDDDFLLFDLPIPARDPELSHVRRQPSTEESRERYAFLKTKPHGSVGQEGDRIFRRTANGVTVFRF